MQQNTEICLKEFEKQQAEILNYRHFFLRPYINFKEFFLTLYDVVKTFLGYGITFFAVLLETPNQKATDSFFGILACLYMIGIHPVILTLSAISRLFASMFVTQHVKKGSIYDTVEYRQMQTFLEESHLERKSFIDNMLNALYQLQGELRVLLTKIEEIDDNSDSVQTLNFDLSYYNRFQTTQEEIQTIESVITDFTLLLESCPKLNMNDRADSKLNIKAIEEYHAELVNYHEAYKRQFLSFFTTHEVVSRKVIMQSNMLGPLTKNDPKLNYFTF